MIQMKRNLSVEQKGNLDYRRLKGCSKQEVGVESSQGNLISRTKFKMVQKEKNQDLEANLLKAVTNSYSSISRRF